MFVQPHSRLSRQLSSIFILAVLVFVAGLDSVNADEIAVWNFNDSDLNVDHGSGTLSSRLSQRRPGNRQRHGPRHRFGGAQSGPRRRRRHHRRLRLRRR